MIHYMNDGQEFEYALDLAREILLQSTGTGSDDISYRTVCEEFLHAIRKFAIYAFSLSEEKDLLSQWRAYCPPEGGFALGFSAAKLRELAEPEGFHLVRCEYDRDAQQTLIRPIVDEILNRAREIGSKFTFLDLQLSVIRRLAEIGASLKHPSFAEEREWRLIATHVPAGSVRYRATRSLIVPYYDLAIARGSSFPVERVVVGPHRHADLAERSLRLMTSAARGWPVKVEQTATPFRVLG
jgi:hypothetical protein